MKNFGNIKKFLGIPQNPVEKFKSQIKDTTLSVIEESNAATDKIYNKIYNVKPDKLDQFQNNLETLMHFTDNYTKIPYGHISSTYGRAVRSNYQSVYERNPIPDKFDRAFDSYKKATEYDY